MDQRQCGRFRHLSPDQDRRFTDSMQSKYFTVQMHCRSSGWFIGQSYSAPWLSSPLLAPVDHQAVSLLLRRWLQLPTTAGPCHRSRTAEGIHCLCEQRGSLSASWKHRTAVRSPRCTHTAQCRTEYHARCLPTVRRLADDSSTVPLQRSYCPGGRLLLLLLQYILLLITTTSRTQW